MLLSTWLAPWKKTLPEAPPFHQREGQSQEPPWNFLVEGKHWNSLYPWLRRNDDWTYCINWTDWQGKLEPVKIHNFYCFTQRSFDLCNIEPGDIGGKCKGDKKHCCFHWEFIIGLNFGLKQRWYVFLTIKGINNPQYLPNDFFALSTFLDDLKPSHHNLSIQICL